MTLEDPLQLVFIFFFLFLDKKEDELVWLMYGLKENLNSPTLSPLIFYVTEFTNYSYNTHNHMLIKGDSVKDLVESYFRDKNLLYFNVVHYLYKKRLRANYYVTKFIGSDKIDWDVILW